MKGNNGTPKLDLGFNETVVLTLTKDKAYVGENSYGKFYLYRVRDEVGEDRSYFASPEVHQELLANGLKSGDQFQIKKIAVTNGGGNKLSTSFEFTVIKKIEHSQNAKLVQEKTTDDGFKELMQNCLQDAVEIIKEVNAIPWQNEDVRSIALTMFIQRARN